ncbi:MAG: SPFH domain-containing protein [Atopobium sp.]|nr:SPFH domain-containing protein [Atopobium sp.]
MFLLITIVLFAVAALFTLNFVLSAIAADRNPRLDPSFPSIIGALVFFFAGLFVSSGLFSLQPGQAKVCVLFGKYIGTVKDEGLRWANPYYAKTLSTNVGDLSSLASGTGVPTVNVHTSIISTRARTLNGDVLKVNDRMGNPIEIAEVVVWRVSDTAKALFDVDDYDSYVAMQAETALRHVASIYSYDHMEDESESNTAITLRSNIEEVSEALQSELSRNLSVAGITVDDARLTHLSYAPEIAQAMLRRQQAEAIIAARKKIVEGAVSMVDMALTQLSENGVVEFDEDRKAVMASNLMVVLCGESEAQPVLNTGSLQQ